MSQAHDPWIATLREQASRGGRAIDGGAAFTPVRDDQLLALLDIEAAARELCRAHYDDDYTPYKDWHKRHDEEKAWSALEELLGFDPDEAANSHPDPE